MLEYVNHSDNYSDEGAESYRSDDSLKDSNPGDPPVLLSNEWRPTLVPPCYYRLP